MKRLIKQSLLFFVALAIMVTAFTGCGVETVTESGEGEMVIYELTREDYYVFLGNYSESYEITSYSSKCVIKTASEKNGVYVNYNDGGEYFYADGVHRVNNIAIKGTLVEFLSGNKNLDDFLSKENISSKCLEKTVICTWGLPMVVCVKTADETYCITVNEIIEDVMASEGGYTYRIYPLKAYYDKVKPQNGNIVVQTEKGTVSRDIMIHNDYAEIPFLFVMESVGATVERESKDVVVVALNDQSFKLDLTEMSLKKVGEDWNYLRPAPGSSGCTFIKDDELMIDQYKLMDILKPFGYELNKDGEKIVLSLKKA